MINYISLLTINVQRPFARARYSRNKTRFINVPEEYNSNTTDNMALLNAALCAGLYPKLLALDYSNSIQQMRTLGNNQPVAFHPSSVNFCRKPSDFGSNYLTYFTIMLVIVLTLWDLTHSHLRLKAIKETICLGNRAY